MDTMDKSYARLIEGNKTWAQEKLNGILNFLKTWYWAKTLSTFGSVVPTAGFRQMR